MKRLIYYFIFIALLLSLLPVALFTQTPQTVYAKSPMSASSEQSLRNQIIKSLANFEPTFSINYVGDVSELKTLLNTIMDDIRKNEPYVYENLSKWEVSYRLLGNSATLNFTIDFLTTKEQEDYVSAYVNELLPTIIDSSASDFDKLKAVHDYIVLNATYSSETKNSQYITYTLLTENQGVCQAYALLMYKMLEELEIDVKYVKGNAGDQRHAWILANVGGAWYHVDPTWNDPIPNRDDEIRYKYFLLSDKQIAKTHEWLNAEYPVASQENYAQFQVADAAFTKGQILYYKNLIDNDLYTMDLKTFQTIKTTESEYKKEKLIATEVP